MTPKDTYSAKRELKRALMELMNEKSYMDITITEIVNRAGVARMSFYRNYNSISDMIDDIITDMTSQFIDRIYPVISTNNEEKWREFLTEFLSRIAKDNMKFRPHNMKNSSVFFSRLNGQIQEKINEEAPVETINAKYAPIAKMGLINCIAEKWIDDGMKETPEELIDYIIGFITTF